MTDNKYINRIFGTEEKADRPELKKLTNKELVKRIRSMLPKANKIVKEIRAEEKANLFGPSEWLQDRLATFSVMSGTHVTYRIPTGKLDKKNKGSLIRLYDALDDFLESKQTDPNYRAEVYKIRKERFLNKYGNDFFGDKNVDTGYKDLLWAFNSVETQALYSIFESRIQKPSEQYLDIVQNVSRETLQRIVNSEDALSDIAELLNMSTDYEILRNFKDYARAIENDSTEDYMKKMRRSHNA